MSKRYEVLTKDEIDKAFRAAEDMDKFFETMNEEITGKPRWATIMSDRDLERLAWEFREHCLKTGSCKDCEYHNDTYSFDCQFRFLRARVDE